MITKWFEVGVCGLSCRLCPRCHAESQRRCGGCKSETRMVVGCHLSNCAVKRKGTEFCWSCEESEECEKWKAHREKRRKHDSTVCCQKLEDNLSFIQKNGIEEFEKQMKTREKLLVEMLQGHNEGRSKTLFCIAATVFEIGELEAVLNKAKEETKSSDAREKSKILRSILEAVAQRKNYCLELRK